MTDTPDPHASPLRHFIDRLKTAEMIPDPYPHYCLDRVFPEAYYQSLLRHLPSPSAYQNLFEITTLKLDHFRFRDQPRPGGRVRDRIAPLRRDASFLGRVQRLVSRT